LLVVAIALGAAACASAPAAQPPSSSAQSGAPANMHLVFGDDFSGSALDTSKWDTCYPWADGGGGCTNFGNNELEWYLPQQDQVSGNSLHLVASQTATTGSTKNGQSKTYDWRSGMVTTFHSLDFTYGYVEVVARVPKGAGFWPTLWLLPQDQSWPPEIDFQEGLGSDTFSTSVTFHSVSTGQHQATVGSSTDLSAGFHTYAVDWEPGSLTWYIDGNVVSTYRGNDVPSQPMYLLADLAISGTNPPDASTPSSASLDIDQVRVFQH
jgi:beta-glucanase (GH16 family)